MQITTNALLLGKPTIIKENQYLSTKDYVEDFLNFFEPIAKYFEINVQVPEQITGNISDLFEAYFSNVSLLNNLILSDNRKIKKLACGGSHTLCLTNNGIVYSWGFGPLGQLGLGFQTNDNKLSKVSVIIFTPS